MALFTAAPLIRLWPKPRRLVSPIWHERKGHLGAAVYFGLDLWLSCNK
jgi:hypothetical protein